MIPAVAREAGLDPEGERDRSLLAAAHDKIRRRVQALGRNGISIHSKGPGQTDGLGATYRILRELLRDMARGHRNVLTNNQRAMCARILDIDELPPLTRGTHPLDAIAASRPLRPPGRT